LRGSEQCRLGREHGPELVEILEDHAVRCHVRDSVELDVAPVSCAMGA
jgi:hypothetical protein